VNQFTTFANQQFPGGSLFLLLSDTELKRFMMELSSKMRDEINDGTVKQDAG